jgi:hypothetical protein
MSSKIVRLGYLSGILSFLILLTGCWDARKKDFVGSWLTSSWLGLRTFQIELKPGGKAILRDKDTEIGLQKSGLFSFEEKPVEVPGTWKSKNDTVVIEFPGINPPTTLSGTISENKQELTLTCLPANEIITFTKIATIAGARPSFFERVMQWFRGGPKKEIINGLSNLMLSKTENKIALTDVRVLDISKVDNTYDFKFEATSTANQNLYKFVQWPSTVVKAAPEETLLKLANSQGADLGKVTGEGSATPSVSGKYTIVINSINQSDKKSGYEGDPPPSIGKWVVEGTPEATALIAKYEAQVKELEAKEAAEKARLEEEAARKKAEEKAAKKAFFALLQPGHTLAGTWRNNSASGRINLTVTFLDPSGAIQGYFSAPNQDIQKPFGGQVTGTGKPEDPFMLAIAATSGQGLPDSVYAERIRYTTLSLLFAEQQYRLRLILDPETSSLKASASVRRMGETSFSFLTSSTTETGADEALATGAQDIGSNLAQPVAQAAPGSKQAITPLDMENLFKAGKSQQALDLARALSERAEPLNEAIIQAVNQGNTAEANELTKQLISTYPASAQALVWILAKSSEQKHSEVFKQAYQLLMKYPISNEERAEVQRQFPFPN